MDEFEIDDRFDAQDNELANAVVVLSACMVNAVCAQPQIDNAKFVGDLIAALEAPATSGSSLAAVAAEELRNRLRAALHEALIRPSASDTAA